MIKFRYLSYFLNSTTPLYGGSIGIEIEKLSDMNKGDTSNSKRITLNNHSGTHIDFPNHFFNNGKLSSDYSADFWIFNHPFILKIKAEENEIIALNKQQLDSIPKNTDFLIFNTGFHKYRDKKIYWNNNPGISPDVASQLRNQCPDLRILGMDTISLNSYQNRDLGRKAHVEFLKENNILIVEDMNLNDLELIPSKIMCFPLLVNQIDGCPVTIIAEF